MISFEGKWKCFDLCSWVDVCSWEDYYYYKNYYCLELNDCNVKNMCHLCFSRTFLKSSWRYVFNKHIQNKTKMNIYIKILILMGWGWYDAKATLARRSSYTLNKADIPTFWIVFINSSLYSVCNYVVAVDMLVGTLNCEKFTEYIATYST